MTAGAISVPTIVPLRAPVLGQHKTAVDTATKIELHSDTDGVTIYYTVNGAKPEPFQTIGPSAKATFRYREPFTLTAGRRTIKAIAIAEDGRESFVVTKVFDVEKLETERVVCNTDDLEFIREIPVAEHAKREVQKFADKMVTGREAWAEVQRMKEASGDSRDIGVGVTTAGSSHKFVPRPSEAYTVSGSSAGGSVRQQALMGQQLCLLPDTSYQALRTQKESDLLKCVRCFAPRSSDPAAKFCAECGAMLPPMLPAPVLTPNSNQMGSCWSCHSLVPLNMPKCLVCEAPFSGQNTLQGASQPRDAEPRYVCTICGTPNTPNRTMSCVTCSANLRTSAKIVRPNLPVTPGRPGNAPKCTDCGRNNNPDSRFCDWCGSKSLMAAPNSDNICNTCSTVNIPGLQYCMKCGMTLSPSTPSSMFRNGMNGHFRPQTQSQLLNGMPMANGQLYNPFSTGVHPTTVKVDAVTQTVGLYYPSQRELSRKEQEIADKMAAETVERKQPLASVSPGRGYWRKQLEHICGHLKAHATHSADFRAVVAEPRLGKLIDASVEEDVDEFSVTVTFELHRVKRDRDYQDGNWTDDSELTDRTRGVSRDLLRKYGNGYGHGHGPVHGRGNAHRPGLVRRSSCDSLDSEDTPTARSRRSGRKTSAAAKKPPVKPKVVKKTPDVTSLLSPDDKKLLKEVGKKGEGQAIEVRQLIEDGASAKCTNKDGIPVLHVAARNGHAGAIPVLVQEGAEVNGKGPAGGNTALHEAIALGSNGYRVIDALLECGANVNLKNDKGESAYDVAVKNGQDAIVKKFAAFLGQSSLDKMARPRPARGATNEL